MHRKFLCEKSFASNEKAESLLKYRKVKASNKIFDLDVIQTPLLFWSIFAVCVQVEKICTLWTHTWNRPCTHPWTNPCTHPWTYPWTHPKTHPWTHPEFIPRPTPGPAWTHPCTHLYPYPRTHPCTHPRLDPSRDPPLHPLDPPLAVLSCASCCTKERQSGPYSVRARIKREPFSRSRGPWSRCQQRLGSDRWFWSTVGSVCGVIMGLKVSQFHLILKGTCHNPWIIGATRRRTKKRFGGGGRSEFVVAGHFQYKIENLFLHKIMGGKSRGRNDVIPRTRGWTNTIRSFSKRLRPFSNVSQLPDQ